MTTEGKERRTKKYEKESHATGVECRIIDDDGGVLVYRGIRRQ